MRSLTADIVAVISIRQEEEGRGNLPNTLAFIKKKHSEQM